MTAADDIISGNQRGGEDDHLEISDRWYGDDSHLEMAYEDAVADPLVNNQSYNDQWIDAGYDEHQEFAYEASLEEFDDEE